MLKSRVLFRARHVACEFVDEPLQIRSVSIVDFVTEIANGATERQLCLHTAQDQFFLFIETAHRCAKVADTSSRPCSS